MFPLLVFLINAKQKLILLFLVCLGIVELRISFLSPLTVDPKIPFWLCAVDIVC